MIKKMGRRYHFTKYVYFTKSDLLRVPIVVACVIIGRLIMDHEFPAYGSLMIVAISAFWFFVIINSVVLWRHSRHINSNVGIN